MTHMQRHDEMIRKDAINEMVRFFETESKCNEIGCFRRVYGEKDFNCVACVADQMIGERDYSRVDNLKPWDLVERLNYWESVYIDEHYDWIWDTKHRGHRIIGIKEKKSEVDNE